MYVIPPIPNHHDHSINEIKGLLGEKRAGMSQLESPISGARAIVQLASKMLALQMADLGLIPSTTYGPPSLARGDP